MFDESMHDLSNSCYWERDTDLGLIQKDSWSENVDNKVKFEPRLAPTSVMLTSSEKSNLNENRFYHIQMRIDSIIFEFELILIMILDWTIVQILHHRRP